MKAMNGCEEDSTMGERWIIGDYKLKRCPMKVLTEDGLSYLDAYKFYKQGILPCDGGWMNQPISFIEAMKEIDSIILDIEKEAQKNKR